MIPKIKLVEAVKPMIKTRLTVTQLQCVQLCMENCSFTFKFIYVSFLGIIFKFGF